MNESAAHAMRKCSRETRIMAVEVAGERYLTKFEEILVGGFSGGRVDGREKE